MNKGLYFAKKIINFIISVIVLSIVVFAISRLTPLDPLQSYYGERVEKMSVEEKNKAREKLGLNDPYHVQYLRFVENALQGDFGISYKYKQDVIKVIEKRLPNTLILGGLGFLIIFFGSLGIGLFCSMKEDGPLDKIICNVGTILSCIPEFWLSLVLIFVFCVSLKVLPSSGAVTVGKGGDLLDRVRHLILPLTIVVLEHLWYYAYMIRNKLLEETRADYFLLYRAMGFSGKKVLLKHCLRNALPAYLSIMAIAVPHILGGTYVVEMVFSYPGIGSLAYESARFADYNLLMLLTLFTGIVVMFFNMLSQMVNELIDPRMKKHTIKEQEDFAHEE